MKNLWYIKLLLVIGIISLSCTRHSFKKIPEQGIPTQGIEPTFFKQDAVCFFKTSIDTYGKSLSGILAVKKQDEDTLKVSFFTEMGVKFFDVLVSHDSYFIVECIPQLNKPAIMNTLIEDIRWVVLWNVKKLESPVQMESDKSEILVRYKYREDWIFADLSESGAPTSITYVYGNGFKSKFNLSYQVYKNDQPSEIKVIHYNFDLNIKLSSISFNP